MSLLVQREPRTCLRPCGGSEGIGDVIEAILGLCEPFRPRDKTARDQLGAPFGLQGRHFRQVHSALELLITSVSCLVMVARHHPLARRANCLATWRGLEARRFPLQATLAVIDGAVSPADLSALANHERA
eukprot:965169-Pyramimonas_sp.AAC.1